MCQTYSMALAGVCVSTQSSEGCALCSYWCERANTDAGRLCPVFKRDYIYRVSLESGIIHRDEWASLLTQSMTFIKLQSSRSNMKSCLCTD